MTRSRADATPCSDLAGDHADRHPHAADAGLAAHDIGFVGDAVERHAQFQPANLNSNVA
jgi:hypothetical protein